MNGKNTRKKIIAIGLFIVLFSSSFVLVSYLFRPITTSRKNICGFYAEKKNSLDVVFIGGSDCYTSWQPLEAWKRYGFTSYNFAGDALQPQVIKYIVEEICKTQSPELLVIDIRPFQYGNLINYQEEVANKERVAPFRNISDNMKYSANRNALIKNCAPKAEAKWTYYFDISKYHSNLYTFFSAEQWGYIFNHKSLYTKGFVPLQDVTPISIEDTSAITEEQPLEADLNALYLELLDTCKQKNLNVLFVVFPYRNSEEDQKKFNYMETTLKEYGFDFVNTNDYLDVIGWNFATDFKDVDHVNLLGADKFTSFFAQYLKNHYEIPDKRADAAYEPWNEAFNKWSAEMERIRFNMSQTNSYKEEGY